jgi:hypothetical protein
MEFTTYLKKSQQAFTSTKTGNAHATYAKKLHDTSLEPSKFFEQYVYCALNLSLHNNRNEVQLFITQCTPHKVSFK